jgi:hypothetical protein
MAEAPAAAGHGRLLGSICRTLGRLPLDICDNPTQVSAAIGGKPNAANGRRGSRAASSASTRPRHQSGAGPGGSPADRGRAPSRRDHWNLGMNVAANLALRRRIDPVRQLGAALVHPLPEGNRVGDGQRRLDRAEAGDMLMAHLAADAAGFHDVDLKASGTGQTW